MANEENIKPHRFKKGERTSEEQARIARKGGIASGKARSFKAAIRERFEKDPSALEGIINAMISEAYDGNVQAANFLRDTIGEKPREKLDAEVVGELNIVWGGEDGDK